MADKEQIIINGANILKEKISMCFILLLNKLETTETIERTIYEHLDAFVDEWNDLFQRKEQECEELKKENQKLEMQLCNDCGERDDYNIPCKMIRDLDYGLQKEIEENDRYREALEDIEKELKEDIYCESQECGCDDFEECLRCTKDQILNIINKVKGTNYDNN